MAGPVSRTKGPLSDQLVAVADEWARSQHQLVVLAAEFADSPEWVIAGAPTAAHWLAAVADVEACTAREWIRIAHKFRRLSVTAAAFADSRLSYSKVRALTRIATAANEHELVDLALRTPAGDLGRALAAWMARNSDPGDLAAHHHQQRSVTWRTGPDGMVTFSLRLPPLVAGMLIAVLTTWVMTRRHPATTHREDHASAVAYPTVAQQHTDALEALLTHTSRRGHRESGPIGFQQPVLAADAAQRGTHPAKVVNSVRAQKRPLRSQLSACRLSGRPLHSSYQVRSAPGLGSAVSLGTVRGKAKASTR